MIFVRNLRVPDVASAGGSPLLIFIRELLRVARWTESSNNGDAGWPDVGGVVNNLVAQPTDLYVSKFSPGIIRSNSSPFSSSMVDNVISLLATNDQNRSMWRIIAVIDANTIKIDMKGFSQWGWVTESGITGRVVKCSTALTATTAQCLWNAPSPNKNQARLLYSAADAQIFYARPKGQVPLVTETTGITFEHSNNVRHIFHMVADGPNVAIWFSTEDTDFELVMWGSLDEAEVEDTDPNFILGRAATSTGGAPYELCYHYMYMLGATDANVQAYVTAPKRTWTDYMSENVFVYKGSRIDHEFDSMVRAPWVSLADVAGAACVRGKFPLLRQCYSGYEKFRPLDKYGTWLHTTLGTLVPRNGPNDPLPVLVT